MMAWNPGVTIGGVGSGDGGCHSRWDGNSDGAWLLCLRWRPRQVGDILPAMNIRVLLSLLLHRVVAEKPNDQSLLP